MWITDLSRIQSLLLVKNGFNSSWYADGELVSGLGAAL